MALDVGERRIGVALANTIARLPSPLTTLDNVPGVYEEIARLMTEHDVATLVVGLPRNLQGEDTAQTAYVRTFAQGLPQGSIVFQDEALTSKKAESELHTRGKPFSKADIDALAAVYILEDYIHTL